MKITIQWTAMMMLMFMTMFGQGLLTRVTEIKHSTLPFERRVTPFGIYSIASFDIQGGTLYLNSFNSTTIYSIENGLVVPVGSTRVAGSDFVITRISDGVQVHSINNSSNRERSTVTLRKTGLANTVTMEQCNGGMRSANGQEITVRVLDRSHLILSVLSQGNTSDIVLPFPNNLGYADCIGSDSSNAFYLLAETYAHEIPLAVNRYVYVISTSGSILSIIRVPVGNQLSLRKEFVIDPSGNLYHLFATSENLQLLKWSGLNIQQADTLYYPEEYYRLPHPNQLLPIEESSTRVNQPLKITSTRTYALHLAEQYVNYTYRITASNLAPQGTIALDGQEVVTPSWLVVGINVHVPYQWGGFSTLEQFSLGLQNGLYAGDVDLTSPSNYAVGVDCSGFVCRCWGLSAHYSTSNMVNITNNYASWDDLKPGDLVHKIGHVRLFIERTPNGGIRVAEAGPHECVGYWTYTLSGVSGYTPRYLYNMPTDFAESQPILRSVLAFSDSTVVVRWNADTTNISGYRVYSSHDAMTWSLLQDETTVKAESLTVVIHEPTFFRVSRVLRNETRSESNWSTVLGASLKVGSRCALIVDAFENQSGFWQGPGHSFSVRYGMTLASLSRPFETACNSEVIGGKVSLIGRPMVFWFTGNESIESESISAEEQSIIASYLESGGRLFISGSDIGYDLSGNGTAADKDFYTKYLKGAFGGESEYIDTAVGNPGGIFAGLNVHFGQNYQEYYPDIVEPTGGSSVCMKYSNGKAAGIQYEGTFGTSVKTGKLVYIGFPLETIADDSCLKLMIGAVHTYLGTTSVQRIKKLPNGFALLQNYPNPFNPETKIDFSIPKSSIVNLKIFDLLGREVGVLINEKKPPGRYSVNWNASKMASGIYFYTLIAGEFRNTRKMMFIK